jgi:hypothetical protein
MNAVRAIITTAELAVMFDRDPDTINRWASTNRTFRAAKVRRGWWRVDTLVKAGVLALPDRKVPG